jgi:NTP pyrophosphatase (non-canonical NTP hydrolase)
MKIDDYQSEAHKTAKSRDIEVFTLGLFGEAGSVASSIKKLKRENTAAQVVKNEIVTELGDVLWYVAEIATYYDIQLSEIAEKNLEKSKYLFNGNDEALDQKAPEAQRFPKKFSLAFEPSGAKVHIRVEGVSFGDLLDDNAHDEDGYRFHDIFHFAYMTRLGWSPVARKQLGLKRKYDLNIDRIEDGARSVFLEEGISVFIFNQNTRTADGVSAFSDRRNIPFSVLSAIKIMTKGLEVKNRDVTAWRDAIAMGFQNFDKLTNHNGGRISCDLVNKKMKYNPR